MLSKTPITTIAIMSLINLGLIVSLPFVASWSQSSNVRHPYVSLLQNETDIMSISVSWSSPNFWIH